MARSEAERLVMLERGCEPSEPTAADIIAYLQVRPDLAVEVVEQAKIARAWIPGEYVCTRPSIRTPRVVAQVNRYPAGWAHEPRDGSGRTIRATQAEAMADADAELRRLGWALADLEVPRGE